jgi:hypothetical protein
MSAAENEGPLPGSWQWAVCGASVTGAQHQRRGLGCDDAYSFGVAGEFVVAAVADGAGSVTGTSAWGSYLGCQSVLADAMRSRFIADFQATPVEEREHLLRWLFDRATQRVCDQAEAFGLEPSLLSTTLCVALADRESAVFGQIGDGIIATEADEQITTLLVEAKDDYANVTWFLQSEGAFDVAFRTATQLKPTAFALSTDGMSYKITNVATGQAYEPFFRGSWEHVRSGGSAADFTRLLRSIEDDQTGDDKTMVLAALRWENDDFHPSPPPVRKSQVSSPPPPLPPSAAIPVAGQQDPLIETPGTAEVPGAVEAPTTADPPSSAGGDGAPVFVAGVSDTEPTAVAPAAIADPDHDAARQNPAEADPLPVPEPTKRRHRFGRRRTR